MGRVGQVFVDVQVIQVTEKYAWLQPNRYDDSLQDLHNNCFSTPKRMQSIDKASDISNGNIDMYVEIRKSFELWILSETVVGKVDDVFVWAGGAFIHDGIESGADWPQIIDSDIMIWAIYRRGAHIWIKTVKLQNQALKGRLIDLVSIFLEEMT